MDSAVAVSGSCVCNVGSRCSGGSMEGLPRDEVLSLKGFSDGEPAMDRARSAINCISTPSDEGQIRGFHIGAGLWLRLARNRPQAHPGTKILPARRACLSARPCRISSSSFLVRSCSSLSRCSPSSRMRSRKSFTSSDPSGFVVVAMTPSHFAARQTLQEKCRHLK